MYVANTHLKPVIGIDIHFVNLPFPFVPLPHPYIGLVIDICAKYLALYWKKAHNTSAVHQQEQDHF